MARRVYTDSFNIYAQMLVDGRFVNHVWEKNAFRLKLLRRGFNKARTNRLCVDRATDVYTEFFQFSTECVQNISGGGRTHWDFAKNKVLSMAVTCVLPKGMDSEFDHGLHFLGGILLEASLFCVESTCLFGNAFAVLRINGPCYSMLRSHKVHENIVLA